MGTNLSKRKLTLSVEGYLIEEAKLYAQEFGRSLSELVEEYLEYLALDRWVEALANELGLGELKPTSEDEILKLRPKGWDAAKVLREIRNGRLKAMLHDDK
jgi:hypothetical protein